MHSSAHVPIDKITAARRQLVAAVRMFFQGEDPLAVHTLTSAAYRLLVDLQAAAGQDEASNLQYGDLLHLVRLYREGGLPERVINRPNLLAAVRSASAALPTDVSQKTASELGLLLEDREIREYWRRHNATANFLKHAEADSSETLDESTIENLELLMRATALCGTMEGDLYENEFTVLFVYFASHRTFSDVVSAEWQESVEALELLAPNERIAFAAKLLSTMGISRPLHSLQAARGDA